MILGLFAGHNYAKKSFALVAVNHHFDRESPFCKRGRQRRDVRPQPLRILNQSGALLRLTKLRAALNGRLVQECKRDVNLKKIGAASRYCFLGNCAIVPRGASKA